MSESSNHDLTTEFKRNPEKAYWLLTKILPAMKLQFVDFDEDEVLSALTDGKTDAKKIKTAYKTEQHKKKEFQAEGIVKAKSAYWFFSDERRDAIKKANPESDFGKINQIMGKEWASLSEKQRETYKKKHLKDKDRYEKEYKVAREEAIENGSFEYDPVSEVKKPLTAYICFSCDESVRKQHLKQAKGDHKKLMKVLGKEWRSMDEEARQPYLEMAAEDKARYEKELKAAKKKGDRLRDRLAKKNGHSEEHSEDNDDEEEHDEPVPKKKVKKVTKKAAPKKKTNKKKVVSSEEEEEDEDNE